MPFLQTLGGGSSRGLGNFKPQGGSYEDQYHLVWSADAGGGLTSGNFTTYNFDAMTPSLSGYNYTTYSNIPTNWQRLVLTSRDRGVVWTFDNDTASRRMLESLCNEWSSWTAVKNTEYGIDVKSGSSRYANTNGTYTLQFMHNNGGSETHDIVTLGNTGGYVWSEGMYWGNIDSTSNYAGLRNSYDAHIGSSGGNTGDRLYVYVDYDHSNDPADYTNYLTPTGPLGNATNFTWDHSGGGGQSGDPSYLADAVSRTTSSNWSNYGFQHADSTGWISVDLGAGNETSFQYTFAIGYPGGSHYATENYVQASNDNSTWVKMAEWKYHNNDNTSDSNAGYIYYDSGSHTYDNTINNIGKWHAIKDRTAYRYWRLRGDNFNTSNGYQLVMNWALLKRSV